jgi:hypothetical protein
VYVGGRVGSREIEMIIQVSKCVEWRVLCVVTESINGNYEFKRIDSRGQAGEYR